MTLQEMFAKHADEYLHFERVTSPPHWRPDLCAFILLDQLVAGGAGRKMIAAADLDEILLDVDCDALAAVATDEDIRLLVRCGVRYDSETDSLAMFV